MIKVCYEDVSILIPILLLSFINIIENLSHCESGEIRFFFAELSWWVLPEIITLKLQHSLVIRINLIEYINLVRRHIYHIHVIVMGYKLVQRSHVML